MTFSCLVLSQWSIKIEKSQTIQSWHESNWLHTRTYIPSSSYCAYFGKFGPFVFAKEVR
jgi:hypothetical protein